ncbi:MAG: hypothetical protein DHS20C02_17620 [Micavibrio sp.]|nr:MAG: hypothetical protein DHS20C02_17620 [Micavibrio sp.]
MRKSNRKNNEAGFTLIDAAIGILLIGIILAAFLRFEKFFAERESFIETDTKIATITDALSTFAQMRWRLPCPANPDKNPNIALGTERPTCTVAAQTHGIIPYRTLGLPEQFAKDNYGNFFTYIVSPVYTRQNTLLNAAGDKVHRRLAHNIVDNAANPDVVGFLPKAQFCGGLDNLAETTDIDAELEGSDIYAEVRDDTPANFIDQPYNFDGSPDPNYFRQMPVGTRIDTFAVAIVSHGPNGTGAYIGGDTPGTNAQVPGFGVGGPAEGQTATIDTLVAMEREIRRAGGANEYDDFVTVLTQDQVMAAAGGGSCEHP